MEQVRNLKKDRSFFVCVVDSERTDSMIKSRESRCGIQRQNRSNPLQQGNEQSAIDSVSLVNEKGGNTPTSKPEPENDGLPILPSSQDTMNGNGKLISNINLIYEYLFLGRLRKASFVENPIENRAPVSKRRCLRDIPTQN